MFNKNLLKVTLLEFLYFFLIVLFGLVFIIISVFDIYNNYYNAEYRNSYIDAKISTTTSVLTIILSIFIVFTSLLFRGKIRNRGKSLLLILDLYNNLASNLKFGSFFINPRKWEMIFIDGTEDEVFKKKGDFLFSLLKPYYVSEYNNYLNDSKEYKELKKEIYIREVEIPNEKNNSSEWFKTRTVNVFFEKKLFFITIFENVTSEHKYTDLLYNILIKTQEKNLNKEQMISHISHEIRTPLNSIYGMNSIAQKNIKNSIVLNNCLDNIEISSEHLTSLLTNVLDLSKIDSGFFELSYDPFELDELIKNVLAMISELASKKEIELNIYPKGFLYNKFIGDKLRISQILTNIFSNAIKFTDSLGKISLYIKTKAIPKSKKTNIIFVISDSGKGMSDEFIHKLFKPYQQSKSDKSYLGTGLGMSITKDLVYMMNGSISFSTKENKGTTFIISIPLIRIDDPIPFIENLNPLIITGDKNKEHYIETFEKISYYEISDDIPNNDKKYNIIFLDKEKISLIPLLKEKYKQTQLCLLNDYNTLNSKINMMIKNQIKLPIFYEDIMKIYKSNIKPNNPIDKLSSFYGLNILIADDDKINLQVSTEFLKIGNFNIYTSTNGIDCYSLYYNSPLHYYQFIILDLNMPSLNGIETAKKIRNCDRLDAKDVKIILMTADSSIKIDKDIFSDYLLKPISMKKLFSTLEELI